jgi:hypothetical protein
MQTNIRMALVDGSEGVDCTPGNEHMVGVGHCGHVGQAERGVLANVGVGAFGNKVQTQLRKNEGCVGGGYRRLGGSLMGGQ